MRTLVRSASLLLHSILAFFRSREEQAILNLALQKQLAVYRPSTPQAKALSL
jgi:hypothetical protein